MGKGASHVAAASRLRPHLVPHEGERTTFGLAQTSRFEPRIERDEAEAFEGIDDASGGALQLGHTPVRAANPLADRVDGAAMPCSRCHDSRRSF